MDARAIPDLHIEQLALGEMDPERAAELMDDPEVARRVRAVRESNREILEQYPPERTAEAVGRRLGRETDGTVVEFPGAPGAGPGAGSDGKTPHRVNRAAVVVALAAMLTAAVLLPAILGRGRTGGSGTGVALEETVRVKGMDPKIHVYRKSGGSVEELRSGSRATDGDRLQLSYNAAGRAFGAIISIDGRGVVSLHYPAFESAAPILERDGEVALDYSYTLDDAPGFERFFFVTSNTEFSLDVVLNAARRLASSRSGGKTGALSLPKGIEQVAVLLRKEASR